MKFASILLILVALLFSACQPTPPETTTESDPWVSFGDLSFYLPEGWSVAEPMEGSEGIKIAKLNVPDSEYDVQLKMTMTEGTTYDDGEPLAQNAEVKVYLVPCGGAYACYALVFSDDYDREVAFDVESTELPPENLDGVWSPSTDVTREELVQFLLSVGLTPES